MKLSCQEHMVPGAAFSAKLASLATWGYDGIELMGIDGRLALRVEEIKAGLADSPVKVSTICGSRPLQFIHPDRANREESVAKLRELAHVAAEVGAVGCIIVPLFNRDPRVPNLEPLVSTTKLQRDLLVSVLRPLAREAADLGVCILLEPLIRYESNFPQDLAEAAAICAEIGSPGFRLMADFFHMNVEEADIAASLTAAAPFLRHIHLADSNRQTPGQGHIDFVQGFRALHAIGYEGYGALECLVPDPPGESLPAAARYIRQCWAEAASSPERVQLVGSLAAS